MGRGQKMGNALSKYAQATIWSSQPLCFPISISISTHGYHRALAPRTRSIMSVKSLEDRKQWISSESWKKIDDRRELKRKMDSTTSERVREQLRNSYSTKNKVTKQLKKEKNEWVGKVAEKAQKAAEKSHLTTVYDATRKL